MTRLYPTYAKDILSFLTYVQLQKCREMSRSINATIVAHPVSIPARRRLQRMYLVVGHAEEFGSPQSIIGEDGYVDRTTDETSFQVYQWWKDVQTEWGCCREEFEKLAISLIGERMIPSQPADSLFRIWIDVNASSTPYRISRPLFFMARNELTTETAFGVLHLFEHLRNVYCPWYYPNVYGAAAGGTAVNPTIIRMLSSGGDYKLYVGDHCLETLPLSVDALVAEVSYLKIGRMTWQESLEEPDAFFGFALKAKSHCKSITLEFQADEVFNSALQYFRATIPRIGRDAVEELTLLRNWPNDDAFWPADLPPKEAIDVKSSVHNEYGPRKALYRALPNGMRNTNSGERFDVEVECAWTGNLAGATERETLVAMRLRFR